jgi:hypothetical protein
MECLEKRREDSWENIENKVGWRWWKEDGIDSVDYSVRSENIDEYRMSVEIDVDSF